MVSTMERLHCATLHICNGLSLCVSAVRSTCDQVALDVDGGVYLGGHVGLCFCSAETKDLARKRPSLVLPTV